MHRVGDDRHHLQEPIEPRSHPPHQLHRVLHRGPCGGHGLHRLPHRPSDPPHQIGNAPGGPVALLRQLAHLFGHHSKSPPVLPRPGRLYGGVQRQEVRLVRDLPYGAHELPDAQGKVLHLVHLGAGQLRGASHLLGRLSQLRYAPCGLVGEGSGPVGPLRRLAAGLGGGLGARSHLLHPRIYGFHSAGVLPHHTPQRRAGGR